MTHKILKSLLLIAGLWVALPSVAYDFTDGKLYYNIISEKEVETTYYKHISNYFKSEYVSYINGDVIIPSQVTYNGKTYKVINIGDNTFNNCASLTSVVIPESITAIGENAFKGCSKLISATIPNSVTTIGRAAFYFCTGLTSITIPNSVTSIGAMLSVIAQG